jgi:hypothetical protein
MYAGTWASIEIARKAESHKGLNDKKAGDVERSDLIEWNKGWG